MNKYMGVPIRPDMSRIDILQAQQTQAGIAQAKLQAAARARLLGVGNPWDAQGPQGQPAPQPLMGAPQGPQGGLLAAPPTGPQPAPSGPQPGVPAGVAPGISPQDYQHLLNQANPDAVMQNMQALRARQQTTAAIHEMKLPANVEAVAQMDAMGLTDTAKALGENLKQPEQVKLIANYADYIAKNGGPTSPAAAPYMKGLTNATQNVDLMKVNEDIRKNMADETNNALSFQQDPVTQQWLLFDKKNKTMTPLGTSDQPLAQPNAQPQPGGQPAPGGQPQQGASAPPAAPAFTNDYIKGLAPDAQARFAQLPPARQPIIAGILSGATPPPPAAGRSPQTMAIMQNQIRDAMSVDPNFNEQKWQARNEATKDMANNTPNSFGGQRVAAQTLIGHLSGLLDAAADNNSTSSLGAAGNYVDNMGVEKLSPGTVGNSTQKKAALENFNVHKIGVGEEGTKVMSGAAGTDTAKQDMEDRFSPNADISSTVGSVGAMADMMRQRVQSQVDKNNGIMGTNQTVEDWLGPEASTQYKRLQGISNSAKAGQPITPQQVKMALRGITTPAAVALRQQPQRRAEFDKKFGQGSAAIVLGK